MPNHVIHADTGRFEWKGFAPTIIVHGPESLGGDTVTKVDAPGTKSVSRITKEGDVTLLIHGVEGVGRPGEARVAKHLLAWFKQQGMIVEFLPGTDERGEDRRLGASGRCFTVQMITVPSDSQLWQDARHSKATAAVDLDEAVRWIDDAIKKKVAKTTVNDRMSMFLVLDAQHANALTEAIVCERYLELRGDPKRQHAFAGVWLVGSSCAHCVRLGTSIL